MSMVDALYRLWHRLTLWRGRRGFANSADYWRLRYARGQTSGPGSYGRLAEFKAEVLNAFVREQRIGSVVEFGCGDGSQLGLARYPRYLGVDVSPVAVRTCRKAFAGDASKLFLLLDEYAGERAELALSLDVVYHLVEDGIYDGYMRRLFGAATRFVAVYSSNAEAPGPAAHVRHRRFTDWIDRHAPEWAAAGHVPNPYPYNERDPTTTFADFFFYARRGT